MLLSGRAEVSFAPEPESAADGFVVSIPDAALVSIVGRPPRPLIIDVVRGLDGLVTVLCQPGDAPHAAGALAGWKRTMALLHTLPARPEWDAGIDEDTRDLLRRRCAAAGARAGPPAARARERASGTHGRAIRSRRAARPGHAASARAHADGRGLGRPLSRVVLLSGAPNGAVVGYLDRDARGSSAPRLRRTRRASDDPPHVANGTIAGLGLDDRQRGVVDARAESGVSGSWTTRRVHQGHDSLTTGLR